MTSQLLDPLKLKNLQIDLLQKVKNHIFKLKKTKFNINYYIPHSYCDGYALLKFWINPTKNWFLRIKIIAREIYLLSLENEIIINKNIKIKKYNKIILTWGNYKNFNSKGEFFDKYYKINNKELKNTLWIIIKTDLNKIKKINNNLIILQKKRKKKINFFKLFKIIFNISLWKYLNFSYQNEFAYAIWNKINKYFDKNVTNLYFPYEGQSFQNYIIDQCKKKFPKIYTIGYVHSFPLGLPTNLIYRFDSPNKIFVNGYYQKKYLCDHLGWNKKNINVINSLRFQKNKIMNSQLFLPYYIEDQLLIYKKLLKLKNHKNYSKIFDSLLIKNHPEMTKSDTHLVLIKKIKKNIIRHNQIKKNNEYSIFIGCSGAAIEALVRNVKIIHISTEPILEIYSSLWKFLNIGQIDKNIYTYNLKKNIKKDQIIKIANQKKLSKNYFIN